MDELAAVLKENLKSEQIVNTALRRFNEEVEYCKFGG